MKKVCGIFVLTCFLLGNSAFGKYSPPLATVEPLSPKGIRISVPDEDGISLVAFHVKFNEDFEGLEAGTIARDVVRARNGRWTYQDRTTRLRLGDIVYYWVHVVWDGLAYNLLDQQHRVTEFFNSEDGAKITPVTRVDSAENQPCAPTETKLVDPSTGERKNICSRQILLDEQFHHLNQSIWRGVEKFTGSPDYAFVVYRKDERNIKCVDGNLRITPTLVQNEYGDDFIRHGNLTLEGCTEDVGNGECQREARGPYILPPVFSGQINTKKSFAFIYGIIEIRARLPRGDWIYPFISLEALDQSSHQDAASTHPQLRIASSNGNSVLLGGGGTSGKDFGGRVLCAGPTQTKSQSTGDSTGKTSSLPRRYSSELWSKDYHVYEVEWGRDKIRTRVDGIEYGSVDTKSPFDKPFYLTLGLAVGGHDEFPDLSTSGGYAKPWRNVGAKALFDFFNATDLWSRTWNDDSSALKIDYVKISAL
ncbi:beta-1,3-glucan-binding protein-like [Venturia canescens]|uniref:beta-1,3-glucan-binding protein-like n=1 Tax=Venturia canescens TaxID=32260 RepID=UPI001C9D02A3|nr:beta-1,3-glucan-binding protein-like [Venturia canescens]